MTRFVQHCSPVINKQKRMEWVGWLDDSIWTHSEQRERGKEDGRVAQTIRRRHCNDGQAVRCGSKVR